MDIKGHNDTLLHVPPCGYTHMESLAQTDRAVEDSYKSDTDEYTGNQLDKDV